MHCGDCKIVSGGWRKRRLARGSCMHEIKPVINLSALIPSVSICVFFYCSPRTDRKKVFLVQLEGDWKEPIRKFKSGAATNGRNVRHTPPWAVHLAVLLTLVRRANPVHSWRHMPAGQHPRTRQPRSLSAVVVLLTERPYQKYRVSLNIYTSNVNAWAY